MVSGKPLSDREKAFIRANKDEKFPTILARHLAINYADDNGGARSTRTVQEYIRRLNEPAPRPAPKKAARAKKATAKL